MKNVDRTRTNTAAWSDKYHRWQIQVQRDGKRKTFYSSTEGRTGQRECNAKADEWLTKGLENENAKVSVVIDRWLETLKPTRKMQSSAYYSQCESLCRNHVAPYIGNKRIGKVTEGDIQRILDRMAKDGKARRTISSTQACISAWLKYSRKNKLTALRLEEISTPKGKPKKVKRILQPSSIEILFSVDTASCHKNRIEDYYVNLYRFIVATGCRPGEILARNKADIESGMMEISTSYNQRREMTDGKNENARRIVPLSSTAIKILEQQRDVEKRNGTFSTLLFPDKDGSYITQNKLYYNWQRYCKSNGIPPISLYELRHTFVSVCKKMPRELLKMVVGHSEDMDTLGVYGHEVDGEREQAAAMIDNSFLELMGKRLTK